MKPLLAALLLPVALVAMAPAARPCGAFFRSATTSNVAVDAQRALLVWRERQVEMHLQLTADTDGAAFAWVLPVPGEPTLALGDPAVFDALDDLTTPSITARTSGGGGGGGLCAGDALKGGLNDVTGAPQHFGGGTLGGYTWDLVGGANAAALATWLGDHGYVVPDGFDAVLADYAGMNFLAVRLTPTAQAVGLPLEPLVVTVSRPGDSRLIFPLGISRLSAAAVTPVVIYTLADKRYRVANAASAELGDVARALRARLEAGESFDYEATIDELTEAGGGRLVITEHSGTVTPSELPPALSALVDADSMVLTRLYARVPRASLADFVVTFAFEGGDVASEIIADSGGHSGPVTLAWAMVALLLGVAWVRPRG